MFVPKCPINNIPAPGRWQTIIWTNDGLGYWRKYASLGLNELTNLSFVALIDVRTILSYLIPEHDIYQNVKTLLMDLANILRGTESLGGHNSVHRGTVRDDENSIPSFQICLKQGLLLISHNSILCAAITYPCLIHQPVE